MLVLSRKNRESVVVGGADGFHRLLKVTVLDIRGTNVKLGFEVDAGVPVHRSELAGAQQTHTHEAGLTCCETLLNNLKKRESLS